MLMKHGAFGACCCIHCIGCDDRIYRLVSGSTARLRTIVSLCLFVSTVL